MEAENHCAILNSLYITSKYVHMQNVYICMVCKSIHTIPEAYLYWQVNVNWMLEV